MFVLSHGKLRYLGKTTYARRGVFMRGRGKKYGKLACGKYTCCAVAGRAGHARTSTTTDIYSHFLKSSDRTAAEKIEELFD